MTKRSAVHRALLLATSALLLDLGGVASAHHSATAIYDGKKHVTITGTLSRLRWINPHAISNVDVKKADNTVETWDFELHSPN